MCVYCIDTDFSATLTNCIFFLCVYVFRPQGWIEEQNMGAFLSVSKGSEEPPVFLELHYNGCPDHTPPPLLLVGKGITFDR